MTRNYPKNPAFEPIKGIIVFRSIDELASKAEVLLKSLHCEVLSSHENRFTVKTSRGNLQAIKQRWQDDELDNSARQELKTIISQIIIGGAVN